LPLIQLEVCEWACLSIIPAAVALALWLVHLVWVIVSAIDTNLLAALGFFGFVLVVLVMVPLVVVTYLIGMCASACCDFSDHEIPIGHEYLPAGQIDEPHWAFWVLYVLSFIPFGFLFIDPSAAYFSDPAVGAMVFVPFGLFHGVPFLVKLVECFYRFAPDRFSSSNPVVRRRLFIGKYFGKGLFFVVQQMNVPLAQYFLDAVFQADIDSYFRVMLTLVMIGIQVILVLVFNILMIDEFAGAEAGYESRLSSVDTAATSNYDIYRHEYRFWMALEMIYELLCSLWINIGSRGYPNVYWMNVVSHLLYTCLHARLRPSLYAVHNFLNIATGVAQLVEDVAVLESIYGSGYISANGLWTLVCAVVPPAVALLVWIYEKFFAKLEGVDETEVSLKERCEIENRMHNLILFFLVLGTGGGLLFLHLVGVAGMERPTGYWWGLYVLTPLFTLTLCISPFVIWPSARSACATCVDTLCSGLGRAVFCCGGGVQIYPEDPDRAVPA
jgi:hypothetical protein